MQDKENDAPLLLCVNCNASNHFKKPPTLHFSKTYRTCVYIYIYIYAYILGFPGQAPQETHEDWRGRIAVLGKLSHTGGRLFPRAEKAENKEAL